MGSLFKPDPPKPPDPRETSAAQTGTNVGTAIANTQMGNVNQYGPDGSLTYSQRGTYDYTDPYTGKTYEIPQYAATTQLSPQMQAIHDQRQGTQFNMSALANEQAAFLRDYLAMPGYSSGATMPTHRMDGYGGSSQPRAQTQSGPIGLMPSASSGPLNGKFGSPRPPTPEEVQNKGWMGTGSTGIRPKGGSQRPPAMSPQPRTGGPASRAQRPGADLPAYGTVPGQSNFERYARDANLIDRNARGGAIQRRVGSGGRITDRIAGAGPIRMGVRNPNVINRDAQGGDITRTYGTGFSEDRRRVERALLERMQPQLDQDREQLDTQLANQGITLGSDAWRSARDDYSRSVNDARLGAILAGGQEQSRMVGMERDRAGFQNAAQAQAFGQDAANIQQRNAAIGQQFGQNLAGAQFANAAQGQRFGQNATRAQFANQAQAQRFGQGLQRGQFANAAQQQAFGQDAANIAQRNAVRQQALGNRNTAIEGDNASLSQLFGQGMQQFNAQNSLRNQTLQEQFAVRNQPINEITALLSGSQVSQPQFQMNQPSPIPTTDNAGLINANYNQRYNNWQQQNQASQNLWGNLFGAAGSFGGAGINAGWWS